MPSQKELLNSPVMPPLTVFKALQLTGASVAGEPRLQVVMLPGNPGSAGYYIPFLKSIHSAFDGAVDILAVSYAGHSWYAGQLDSELYTLEEQIHHKTKFLEQHVLLPGKAPAVVLGHSIGTYIAIHAVHRVENNAECLAQASSPATPPPIAKVGTQS